MHALNITRRGVTSIEVVIGVSIAGIILAYAAYAISTFINTARDIGEKTEALYLAEDGLELLRYVRDNAWTNISSIPQATTRYLEVTSGSVAVTTVPETVDGFSRSFRIENVYRDSDDDIVASTTPGSSADTESNYVTVTVSWNSGAESLSLTSILADITP